MLANYPIDAAAFRQYQLIKLAWNEYQCAPESLDETILSKLEPQAETALQLMTAVLASAESEDQKITVQEVDFCIEHLQSQFENPNDFSLCLEKQGISQKQLHQIIYRDLLCEKTIAAQSQNVPEVSEEEALVYYQINKARFSHPERRKVSHILITINNDYPENRRKVASSRINTLREKLMVNIDDFSQCALSNSECPSALQGGLIGTVARGQLYPELDEVLFNMAAQAVSSVVESEIGLHLLLCHEIYPAGETEQADAVKEISKQLNDHRKKKQQKKWVSSLFARS
ncbi:MAG: nitrogen fixation protein NifM [Psychromonas sp.]